MQPGGPAGTPAWTGPSAVRPKWSSPGSKPAERPAWLGAAFDHHNAPPHADSWNKVAGQTGGEGSTQDRSQGRLCEFGSLRVLLI